MKWYRSVSPKRKADPIIVDKDEDYTKVKFDKLSSLPPAFEKMVP